MPECRTILRYDERAERLEVTHRIHRHDAEQGFAKLLGEPELRLQTLKNRARFALHLESQFALRDAENQQPVPLTLLGAELIEHAILVYQEYLGPLPEQLEARHDLLRRMVPDQQNSVLLKLASQSVRVDFRAQDRWLPLIPPAAPLHPPAAPDRISETSQ